MIVAYPAKRPAAWIMVGISVVIAGAAVIGMRQGAKSAEGTRGPTTQAVQDKNEVAVRAVLRKEMPTVNLNAIPFGDVLDFLKDVTGAKIRVNWQEVERAGVDRKTPVSVHLQNVRFHDALDVVLKQVGKGKLAYEAGEDGVSITTVEELSRGTVTRAYDIRDLLMEVPNFVAPRTLDGPAGSATRPVMKTRAERVEEILRILRETIAPDSWRANGGTMGSVRETRGELIVTQTRANQAGVAQILAQLHESVAIEITVETRYVFVDQETMDRMGFNYWASGPSKVNGGSFVMDERMNRFLRAVQEGKEATITAAPRMTLFNGQRGWVGATKATSYVKDFTVVRTEDGQTRFESQMGTVQAGLVLDLQATASADRKSVTMTIRSTMSVLKEMKSKPFAGGIGGMRVQVPDVLERTTETTATIPDGMTMMLAAMTPEAAEGAGARPKGQTFIFIKPTIFVQQASKEKK